MNLKILSLNSGHPKEITWDNKTISSSMLRVPVEGPLVVHKDYIEGNSFASPTLHGVEHSVLYAFGMKSLLSYLKLLGRTEYDPGALGENVTLDDLDENEISVGDIFEFGEVQAQATFPRIPCGKVNIRMQHPQGQKLLQECGRSGVYFRILKPGKIHKSDPVKRIELAPNRFSIADLYKKYIGRDRLTQKDFDILSANKAFPQMLLEKTKSKIQ